MKKNISFVTNVLFIQIIILQIPKYQNIRFDFQHTKNSVKYGMYSFQTTPIAKNVIIDSLKALN